MKFIQETLANNKFTYEIDHDTFNKMMNVKKTAQRYDKNGIKKVKITDIKNGKGNAAYIKSAPIRIKSEYMKGPFAIVFMSTPSEMALDPNSDRAKRLNEQQNVDYYVKQATMIFEEGEGVRVYRDSINDGYTNAKFCDDSVMLMMYGGSQDNRRFFKVEGEPTCLNNFKFEHGNENMKAFYEETVNKMWEEEAANLGLPKEKVYVVMQLENV